MRSQVYSLLVDNNSGVLAELQDSSAVVDTALTVLQPV